MGEVQGEAEGRQAVEAVGQAVAVRPSSALAVAQPWAQPAVLLLLVPGAVAVPVPALPHLARLTCPPSQPS